MNIEGEMGQRRPKSLPLKEFFFVRRKDKVRRVIVLRVRQREILRR